MGRITTFPTRIALAYLTLTGVLGVRGYRVLRSPTHRLQVRWLFFSSGTVLHSCPRIGRGP